LEIPAWIGDNTCLFSLVKILVFAGQNLPHFFNVVFVFLTLTRTKTKKYRFFDIARFDQPRTKPKSKKPYVVTNRGISLPRDFQNCPGMGKNTIPGLFLEVAFVGLK